MFAQSPAAKLVVKNAYILTMASGRQEPVRGYLAVGEDGRLLAVAAGDPPAGMQATQTWDAGGHWVIPGFIGCRGHSRLPYASLVFVAGERDLERVYVSGDLLVQNGAFLKQDIAKVRSEVNRRVAALR